MNTITPVIAVLIGVVGSLVFTAIAIMIVARVKAADHDKSTTANQPHAGGSPNGTEHPTPQHKHEMDADLACEVCGDGRYVS